MFWRRKRTPPEPVVCMLNDRDPLTLHQAYEGILVTGGIGAGKTSGPGDHAGRGLLRQKVGFLVLTAKVDEAQRWARMCREEGRAQDLVMFGPGSGLRCDLLNVELSAEGGSIETAAALLDDLVSLADRSTGGGEGDQKYWNQAAGKLFRAIVGAVYLGKVSCSVADAYLALTSAPTSVDANGVAVWPQQSFLLACLQSMQLRHDRGADATFFAHFFSREWPGLSDKTRSIIQSMATNVLVKFMTGPVAEMVSGPSSVLPTDPADGKVLVLDMPVLRWREPGQFFQTCIKTLVQRAVLRRDLSGPVRPVCIWGDEFQYFIVPEQDAMTQTVARQSRLISVALTQNLPILYSQLGGGEKARQDAHAFIANHVTKILCSNSDKETNEYFSELLGHSRHLFMSGSAASEPYNPVTDLIGGGDQRGPSFSEQWHPDVPPAHFTKLAKGSHQHNFIVEAICFQGGRKFSNGKTWVKGYFPQRV